MPKPAMTAESDPRGGVAGQEQKPAAHCLSKRLTCCQCRMLRTLIARYGTPAAALHESKNGTAYNGRVFTLGGLEVPKNPYCPFSSRTPLYIAVNNPKKAYSTVGAISILSASNTTLMESRMREVRLADSQRWRGGFGYHPPDDHIGRVPSRLQCARDV